MIQTKSVYTFHSLPTMKYGVGALEEVGHLAQGFGSTVLVISDPIMESLGVVDNCLNYLHAQGLQTHVYTGVVSEPVDTYVDEGLKLLQDTQCDVIVSIGGGSCIDTAKAIAVVATNGGYVGDYMKMQKIVAIRPVPHIAIPTTAGTGSEATDATVITDTKNDIKMMIKQPAFMPSAAIVDPLLCLTSPKSITAATGIDALSHAIEGYLSRLAHPYSDLLALSAMELIINNLLPSYEDGTNLTAREAMSLGSMQAGAAFSNASVALVHGMSRPIGALFHVPHGISNAMLLPAVLEYSKDACIPRLAKIGTFFAGQTTVSYTEEQLADLVIDSIKDLCKQMNIGNLRQYGIEEDAFFQAIDKMATDAIASGSPANNPKVPSFDDLKALYKIVYDYEF
ncbi:iron-containing alcohol dehydrogenase [Solibacillus sp. FSL K6-1523]|uniref:iron-containing alcohol dehydrogenase n=1 Tax=Solibacillus sp. FSL K6-1523 TaxID=2921471 RepID=UPI0030F4E1E0